MKRHSVLLVDDDPSLLEGLRRALRKEDYDIRFAHSAREGLEALREQPADAVVSDQNMPGGSGTELLACIREQFPHTVRFILTGKATLEVAVEAINNGAVHRFFQKPCNTVDLAVSLRQALEHKDLMDKAWRLSSKVQEQSAVLERIEKDNPGIAHVKKDAHGAVQLTEMPIDYESFVKKLRKALPEAE